MRKRPLLIAAVGFVAILAGTTYAQPNDECDGAERIECDSVVFGSTTNATFDGAPTCVTTNTSPGVWYVIEGTGAGITIDTCGDGTDYDTKLSVYTDGCGTLTCVTGNDDDVCGDFRSKVSWTSNAGQDYLVLVHGFGGAVGNFELTTECELTCDDCNSNGVCDDEDIENGTSSDCNGDGIPDECQGEVLVFEFVVNIPIPDDDPAGVSDTQTIGVSDEILDVDVDVIINHTWIGDLIIDVEHNATTVRLWDRQCGGNNNMDVIFDDEGDPVVCNEPTVGRILPVEDLRVFDGMDLLGDWTITVSDNAGADLGTLVQWSLHISIPAIDCCLGTLLSSDTIPDTGIDAREEHASGDPGNLTGLSAFLFTFDDNQSITEDCFEIDETGGGTPPNVAEVNLIGDDQVEVVLDRPITAGEWTTVTYTSDVPVRTRIGFLPGDVNQSSKSTGADIIELINCLNNQAICALYQSDIDRSGDATGNDITRLIDVLNESANDPFGWLNEELPPLP